MKTSLLVFTSPAFYDYYYHAFASEIPRVTQECVVNPFVLEKYQRNSNFPATVTMAFFGNMRYLSSIKTAASAVELVEKARFKLAGFTQNRRLLNRILKKYPATEYIGIFKSSELGALYSKVDVIYCVYETDDINATVLLPNKYYESIQLGIPIIVAKGTYLGELVLKYDIGYVIDEKDTGRLAEILQNLDENEMRRIAVNCEKVRSLYDVRKHNVELVRAYEEQFR